MNRGGLLAGFAVFGCLHALPGICQTPDLRGHPVEVYRAPDAVPAEPYLRELLGGEGGEKRSHQPSQPRQGVIPMQERLPLVPVGWRAGPASVHVMEGMNRPLFVLGMDQESLSWLAEVATTLAAIGARGVVIQADDKEDWLALQAAARDAGVDLDLADGEVLLGMYPATTYPALFVSPELANRLSEEGAL